MAGLVPAMTFFVSEKQAVDARVKPGHDEVEAIKQRKRPRSKPGPDVADR
jgi:hypothetical protein